MTTKHMMTMLMITLLFVFVEHHFGISFHHQPPLTAEDVAFLKTKWNDHHHHHHHHYHHHHHRHRYHHHYHRYHYHHHHHHHLHRYHHHYHRYHHHHHHHHHHHNHHHHHRYHHHHPIMTSMVVAIPNNPNQGLLLQVKKSLKARIKIYGRTNGYMDEWIGAGWVDWWTDRWMDGLMDGCGMDWLMDDESIDGLMDGWMNESVPTL